MLQCNFELIIEGKMTLHTSREVKRALETYIIPKLKNSKNYYKVKVLVKDQSKEILIPEGTPKSRSEDIKNLIDELDNKVDPNNIADKKLLHSLKKEADSCLNLPVSYSNPNINNVTASNNRCYTYEFKELLSVINKNPEAIFEDF
jgi:hypothetical protein